MSNPHVLEYKKNICQGCWFYFNFHFVIDWYVNTLKIVNSHFQIWKILLMIFKPILAYDGLITLVVNVNHKNGSHIKCNYAPIGVKIHDISTILQFRRIKWDSMGLVVCERLKSRKDGYVRAHRLSLKLWHSWFLSVWGQNESCIWKKKMIFLKIWSGPIMWNAVINGFFSKTYGIYHKV